MNNLFTIETKSAPNETLELTLNRLFIGFNQSHMAEGMDTIERVQTADDFLQIQLIVRQVLAHLPEQE